MPRFDRRRDPRTDDAADAVRTSFEARCVSREVSAANAELERADEFPVNASDASQAWEDFFVAAKGTLSVSEIAKIRDSVGVVGMAGH